MAHEQKPDLVFRRNGHVHLNRRGGRQFSRLLRSRGVRISGSNAGVWNVMAHAQKPDFVFRAKRTSPFKSVCGGGGDVSSVDYCAAEVCASAVVMLDTPCSVVVWRVLAAHCIRQLPLHFLSLRPRVPSHFNWSLQTSAFPDLFTRWEERSDPESIYNVYLVFKNILQK